MSLRIQADEISFLLRVSGLSLRDRVRSSDIRGRLGVELLLERGWGEGGLGFIAQPNATTTGWMLNSIFMTFDANPVAQISFSV